MIINTTVKDNLLQAYNMLQKYILSTIWNYMYFFIYAVNNNSHKIT